MSLTYRVIDFGHNKLTHVSVDGRHMGIVDHKTSDGAERYRQHLSDNGYIEETQIKEHKKMKSRTAAIAWAFFLGGVGAHKFYLRQPLWGVIYATFFWTAIPAILSLIEVVILLCTSEESFSVKYN